MKPIKNPKKRYKTTSVIRVYLREDVDAYVRADAQATDTPLSIVINDSLREYYENKLGVADDVNADQDTQSDLG